MAPVEALPQPAPAKLTEAPPALVAPGEPVTSGLAPLYGAKPAPVKSRETPPMKGLPAAVQAALVAQGAAVVRPPDISELLAQALDTYRQEVAGGEWATPAATGTDANVGELIAHALAASRPKGVVSTPDVAKEAEEAVEELRQLGEVGSGRKSAERSMARMQEGVVDLGAVAPCRGRTDVEGVEEWMWEWREWRKVAPRGPCPAGLVYSMDLDAGTGHARLPDNLQARLDAAEAARGIGADQQPLAPFPPRPKSPPAEAPGGEGERVQEAAVANVEEKEAYKPGESALALMYEDDTGPDVDAWTCTRPTRRCCPCPTRCRPLPWGVVSSGTAASMRPRVPTGTTSRAQGGERRGCWRALWSATSSSIWEGSPGRTAWWPCPQTMGRSAASKWGMQRSWITTQVRSGRLSRKKTSPCQCACR